MLLRKISSCFLQSFLGNSESFLVSRWKFSTREIGNSVAQARKTTRKQMFPILDTMRDCFLARKRPYFLTVSSKRGL